MRIAVTSSGASADDPFDERFGRASFLLLYDTEENGWEAIDNGKNKLAQSGAGIGAAALLAQARADVLLTGHVGPKAEQALAAAGISFRTVECASPRNGVETMMPQVQQFVDGGTATP